MRTSAGTKQPQKHKNRKNRPLVEKSRAGTQKKKQLSLRFYLLTCPHDSHSFDGFGPSSMRRVFGAPLRPE